MTGPSSSSSPSPSERAASANQYGSTRDMSAAALPPHSPVTRGSEPSGGATLERASLARRTLVQAILLGFLADALLRDGPSGIGLFLWMLAFSAGVVALAWRRGTPPTREHLAWLGTAVFFSAGLTWRHSEGLQVFDFLAMIVALALLAATMSTVSPIHSVLGTRVRDLVQGLARAAGDVAAAVLPLTFFDSDFGSTRRQLDGHRSRALLRATLITLPLLLLFGVLLGEADPIFKSFFSLPEIDLETLMSHVVIAGLFTWITGGWMRGALVDTRPRSRASDRFPITLGTLEITIVLGALTALFTLFVGVQIGWLFGGEALVRSTTGLSYAQYARRGFFELVWVSLLLLPVLLGTRAAIAAGDEAAVRRHRQLAVPLLVLLGAIMISALGRMRLYVDLYGLTSDRLFATVFMLWLAVVFVWLGLTVLRGRGRDFAAGMTITGFLTLGALNALNPDALIARVNVDRAPRALLVADTALADSATVTTREGTRRSPIDYAYLTRSLGGDAADVVVRALIAPPVSPPATLARMDEVKSRCNAVRRLFDRWGPVFDDDAERRPHTRRFRQWNLGAWRAETAVRANEKSLRAVTCWDTDREMPFGDREQRSALFGEQGYVAPPKP